MADVTITNVNLNEIDMLQKISKVTFIETFAEQNTEADMQQYLNTNLSIEKLSKELLNEHTQFYFASLENRVIGYLKVNLDDAQTEIHDSNCMEIERIYVLKEFHGKQIAPVLLKKAIEIARIKDSNYIWLGVWEKNERAINFYLKNGFVEFGKHLFQLGNDQQTDIMMKLNLKA